MQRGKLCGVILSFLLCALCFSQAVPAQSALEQTSLSIRDRLLYLKQESESMKEQLETLSASLKSSESAQQILTEQLKSSSASLMTINEQLNDCYDIIEKQREQLRWKTRVVASLLCTLLALLVIKIVAIGFYIKGVKLPRLIDILA